MKRLLPLALLLFSGLAGAQTQSVVNCAPGVACNPITGPINTKTGDPAWTAFGKLNADISTLWPLLTVPQFSTIPNNTVLGNTSGAAAVPSALSTISVTGISLPATTNGVIIGGTVGYNPIHIAGSITATEFNNIPCSGDTTGATDPPAIQAALNALMTTHGTVTLGACTYYLNTSLIMPNTNYWAFAGTSMYGTILMMMTNNTPILLFNQPASGGVEAGFSIKNMSLFYNTAQAWPNSAANGIYFQPTVAGAQYFQFDIDNINFGTGYRFFTVPTPQLSPSQNTSTGVWTTPVQNWIAGEPITVGRYNPYRATPVAPTGFTNTTTYYVAASPAPTSTSVALCAAANCAGGVIVPSVSSSTAYLQGPTPAIWNASIKGCAQSAQNGAVAQSGSFIAVTGTPVGNPNWRISDMSLNSNYTNGVNGVGIQDEPLIQLSQIDNILLENLELLNGTWPIPEISISTSSFVTLINDKHEYATVYGGSLGGANSLWQFSNSNVVVISAKTLSTSVVNHSSSGAYASFINVQPGNGGPASNGNGLLAINGMSVNGAGTVGSTTHLYPYTMQGGTGTGVVTGASHIALASGAELPIFALSGGTGACTSTSTLVGGGSVGAGSFLCTGTAGASSITVTFPAAIGTFGISCAANDDTSGVAWGVQSSTVNSMILTGTIATTSDKVTFGCIGN